MWWKSKRDANEKLPGQDQVWWDLKFMKRLQDGEHKLAKGPEEPWKGNSK